ncbi:MAG: DUF262 domain-containing protein [Methylocystis sp.]|nr:DUF262 domain-containing protein [Methylocystis sp.]MCA3582759.1 DUF262 domain-containing protein [Methylocystis sp.]MCA3588475.1 DUF262 domain-containing protein [Methylocystis sp.]MCA3592056.1 DUF262 domain-containing protein [Methylocystis sp.]
MSDIVENEIGVKIEEDAETFTTYDIATYPSDLTLQGIVDLWKENQIQIPDFQRNYVWTLKQASLLIESFLIGLPVPPVMLYIDNEYNNLVIDGQQRLVTIRYFFEGFFGPEDERGRRRIFRLEGLGAKSPYRGLKFETLEEKDKRKLKSYVLRAINIKQLGPTEKDPTSIYHIFERLNTGGTPLKPQEIRNCIYAGPIVDFLREANKDAFWREIVGVQKGDKFQRDVELVLRVYALSDGWLNYEPPMKDFLSIYMKSNRVNIDKLEKMEERFRKACELALRFLGEKPFHINGPLNAAVLDVTMAYIMNNPDKIDGNFKLKFDSLFQNESFNNAVERATADKLNVARRFQALFSP